MNERVKLNEILHPNMDILFLALNPPEKSNNNGHYFSNNLSFWNLMLNSGLITKSVKSKLTGDDEVFRSNKINFQNKIYGITDLCHDVVQTKSSGVFVDKKRIERIITILETHDVKILCIVHSKVGDAFEKIKGIDRNKKYGLIGKIHNTLVYEMPFHNASILNKEKFYRKLIE